jgi:molybdate transport system substrate-binding protein
VRAAGTAVGLAAALLVLPGCGSDPSRPTTLDVLAAASLTGAFEELAEELEADHPDIDVRLSFGSSAALAQQVLEGAPADVLATADLATMATAVEGDGAADPVAFATNRMVLVTPRGDDGPVDGFEDLDDPATTFAACVESAPCGAVAARLLEENQVERRPVSLEADVKAVLTKVLGGEVDAGLVYETDALAAGDRVRSVPVPGSGAVLTTCTVAVTSRADDPEAAQQFVALVTGDRGRQVLTRAGFGAS